MFDLFITDLDGTLLDDEKNISKTNLMAIQKLRKAGIAFSVFTGRDFSSAYQYIDELDIDGMVALQNGALILEMPSRRVINEISLNKDIALNIYNLTKDKGYTVIAYAGYNNGDSNDSKDMYVEKKYTQTDQFEEYFQHNIGRIHLVDSLNDFFIGRNGIGQFAIIGNEPELKKLLQSVKEINQDNISYVLSPMADGSGFLEFFGPKVSKGDALEFILKKHNTTAAKTVFIGDNYNDLPLMKRVGLPVATGNALREIKDHCKMVVSSNNNDGVKEAIERIFF